MNQRFINATIAVIPSAAISFYLEWSNGMGLVLKIGLFLLSFVIIFFLLEVILFLWNGVIKAKISLWRNGKIKGLWTDTGLIKQLEKGFNESDDIRIKVTRGYDLFQSDEKYGFVNFLDKLKKENAHVNIRFLLIIPCFKEKHVQERYSRHRITKEKFLETWYESISEMEKYSNGNLSLDVRFYLGGHARWRFYVFSKGNGSNVSVFLSDYDKNTAGTDHPMYKIIRKDPNIASFMTSYFDELWKSGLTPLQLHQIIEKGQCVRYFCSNCEQESKCLACPHAECIHIEQCKELIKKYEKDLKAFNVG